MIDFGRIFGILIPVFIVGFVIAVICMGYVKASPDEAIIISGPSKKPRILIGKAGVRLPFLERIDRLTLKQVSIDIKTDGYIPTKDYIGVNIDAIAKIRVKTDVEGIQLAMKNFLNMREEHIARSLTDSLQGNMREIIGTMDLKSICNDRKTFGDQVQEKAQIDMNALGIEIISCNIQSVRDENNLINALGQDNMSQIQKDASIAKAQADRDVAIAKAEARKAANEAEVAAATEIAVKQNELEIKRSELKKEADIKKAVADAAYIIQEQEQRKTIEVAEANANIARQEREIELKQKEADVREQELAATVRKQAEAEKYRVQQKSDADLYRRQKEAEAQKYEAAQAAEAAKVKADADKYAKEQEAAGIAAVGKAEARAIQAKGLAEAEALEKKAEAMTKYGQAAILEMVVNTLPDMAREIAKPLESIDKVTIIDGGGAGSGVDSMGGYVPSVLAKTMEAVKETTGVDIKDIIKAQTYDAKVNKNVNVTGITPAEITDK